MIRNDGNGYKKISIILSKNTEWNMKFARDVKGC